MGPFEYLEPETVEEALSLLRKYSDRAKVCAGGTDLVVQMRERVLNPQFVIGIAGIRELDHLRFEDGGGLTIGSLTTIRTLERSPELRGRYGMLPEVARQFGSIAIRNVATIGGNLCNALPSADMAPMLIALSAKVKLVTSDGERIVPLEDFFIGPGSTVLDPDELMVEIQVPVPPKCSGGTYLKYSVRGGEDIALVGVAVLLTFDLERAVCKDSKIVLGAVGPTPMRAHKAELTLKQQQLTEQIVEKAAETASSESKPVDDIRGSAEYRREMVRVFTTAAIHRAAERVKATA